VVCDFDGTVATEDVQHVILNHFAGDRWIPVNEAWRRGEVTTEERSRRQWDLIPATAQQILDLVMPIPLDPRFADLVGFCRRRGWRLRIASDGFDFYIRPMLAAHGLAGISFSANHLEYVDGHAHMRFLRPNPACCRLGNCKRLIVNEARPPRGRVIYVGDGLSDACGAEAADAVFAKGLLAGYCESKGIAYMPFRDFGDVMEAVEREA
jgi:2,3-diketo-5-methylthio-1-phosphopentane phosphatase